MIDENHILYFYYYLIYRNNHLKKVFYSKTKKLWKNHLIIISHLSLFNLSKPLFLILKIRFFEEKNDDVLYSH